MKRAKTQVDERYNGWKNYETWNVALWIGNDEGLYSIAKDAKRCRRSEGPYATFVDMMKEFDLGAIAFQTPDGVSWNDSGLDVGALDEMMGEL